jgi:hypothetical protein
MNTTKSLDELLATLGDKLDAGGHNLMPMLGVMSRFSHYSLSNQLLIYLQCPTASRVLGFQGWRKAGYAVRKGEKGIAIYAPMRFAAEETPEPAPTVASPTSRMRFRVAYVFDISQVDALNGADAIGVVPPTDFLPSVPLACIDAIKIFIASEHIALVHANLAPGHFGSTDGKTITCGFAVRHASNSRRSCARPRSHCCISPATGRTSPRTYLPIAVR